jgi:hypothetical protein
VSKWRYGFIQEILVSCFPAEALSGSFLSAVSIYVKKCLSERDCRLFIYAIAFLFVIAGNVFVSTANGAYRLFAGPRIR